MKNYTHGQIQSKNSVMTGLMILIILITSAINASAQKSMVVSTLAKYGIDQRILDPANLKLPVDHAFDLKETTTTAGKSKIVVAKFQPSRPPEDQWTVVSVDGKSPSLYEINTFRNTKAKQSVDKPDESTYRIENDSIDQLVISYKLDPASVPKEASFVKDCRIHMTINSKTKQLLQSQLLNEKQVKVGPLQAKKFEIVTKYVYNEPAKRYFPISNSLLIDAEFITKAVTTQINTSYSNYTR